MPVRLHDGDAVYVIWKEGVQSSYPFICPGTTSRRRCMQVEWWRLMNLFNIEGEGKTGDSPAEKAAPACHTLRCHPS